MVPAGGPDADDDPEPVAPDPDEPDAPVPEDPDEPPDAVALVGPE